MSPTQPLRRVRRARRQHGGALVVAVIILCMLSLLGVSAMRSSTMERQMASNAIQASTVFHASESTTEVLLNDPANLGSAYMLQGEALELTVDLRSGETLRTEGELRYVGDGAAIGYSLGAGGNNFMALRYDVRGTAELDSVRAHSSVTQGAYRIVPVP